MNSIATQTDYPAILLLDEKDRLKLVISRTYKQTEDITSTINDLVPYIANIDMEYIDIIHCVFEFFYSKFLFNTEVAIKACSYLSIKMGWDEYRFYWLCNLNEKYQVDDFTKYF